MSSIRSCVTISLVEEARGGPFVYWDDFDAGCRDAAALGFDAVELFAPSPNKISVAEVKASLDAHGIGIGAVGTGAGMVIHGHSLSNADDAKRSEAVAYARGMVQFGVDLGVPAIVGSMQGRADSAAERPGALERLADSMRQLDETARAGGVRLLLEPINRYESNLCNTLADGIEVIAACGSENVKILGDLFHMNIEEAHLEESIREAGAHLGHIHFADSNRRAVGFGHTDLKPAAEALKEIGFDGFASAEVFALPDSAQAAAQTKQAFDALFG